MEREAITYKDLVMTVGEIAVPVISQIGRAHV